MSDKQLQIGVVAERTGLSVRTLRHWDDVGLVGPSARSPGGFRLYTEADVARLLLVRRMKPLGFTLEEMAALLHAVDHADSTDAGERAAAQGQLRDFHDRSVRACGQLRVQLGRAEELAAQLAFHAGPPP